MEGWALVADQSGEGAALTAALNQCPQQHDLGYGIHEILLFPGTGKLLRGKRPRLSQSQSQLLALSVALDSEVYYFWLWLRLRLRRAMAEAVASTMDPPTNPANITATVRVKMRVFI